MNTVTQNVTKVNFIRTASAQPELRDEATAAMRARAYDLRSLGTLLNSQALDFWQIGNSDTCVGRKCQEEAQKLHNESNAHLDMADSLLHAAAFCDVRVSDASIVLEWMNWIENQQQETQCQDQTIQMQFEFSAELIGAR